MKPNFALSLSVDGIRLMQRSSPGWLLVGEVALDDGAFGPALERLREQATLLAPDSQLCKLVLPNDQIRYLTIATAPASESERRKSVETALDGATPYDLDELVYDFTISGGETHIAAVARETLDEAEEFAEQHGFDAVTFTAIPPEGAYRGEPDFGRTRAAGRLLSAGDSVETDALPIRILGTARLPDATQAPVQEPEQTPVPEELTLPETSGVEKPEAEAAAPEDETPVTPAFSSRRSAPAAEPAPAETQAAEATPEAPAKPPAPEKAALFDPSGDDEDIAPKLDLAAAHRAEDAAAPTPAPASSPEPDLDPEAARSASIASLRPEQAGDTDPSDLEPVSDSHALKGLLTRLAGRSKPQAAEEDTPAPKPAKAPRKPAAKAPKAAPEPQATEEAEARPVRAPNPALVALAATQRDRHGGHPGLTAEAEPAPTRPATTGVSPTAPITAPAAAASATLGGASGSMRQASREEAERMTVFGARAGGAAAHRPRYMGLFLTVVLLLLMAGVAAWAGIFSDSALASLFRRAPQENAVAAALPAPEDAPATPEATPGADSEADSQEAPRARELAALPTPEEQAESEEPPQVDDALARLTGTQPEQPQQLRAVPREAAPQSLEAQDSAAAEATYAATGIWPQAPDHATPPPAASLSDLYVASIDGGVPNLDAIALPLPEGIETDQRPATPLNPPPAGTQFVLDDRGLVAATPDGAMTPAGGRVYAGNPPLLPPERPAETQIAALVPGVPRTIGGVNLDAFRPRVRPDGLQERNERSELGGFTRDELADLRPRLRPSLPEAQQETEENAPGTEFAVGASLFPRARPQDFASRVTAAQQAPATPQVSAAAAAAVAAAPTTPARNVAPSIPSSASVTRQATMQNVMRLNQINLIGVYGQPSDRRALIRLSNGRYRKVQVGDTIDGGKVAAIGDSELRYVKRGRDVILRMPTEG
ncbi:hypothetical protein [Pseudooceanicola nanhaiensis]|uniref:hypothetical protein n=1 Tax=Pseudooceanicola nanhaiensis TaxID=375761 RepID=UPI001CD56692|nr:hypothetical protein [Pseudooceanicola nanhaiensis]MCA0919621.1 hypothetical protein [Pseudooceanicola nanhaiensis]